MVVDRSSAKATSWRGEKNRESTGAGTKGKEEKEKKDASVVGLRARCLLGSQGWRGWVCGGGNGTGGGGREP